MGVGDIVRGYHYTNPESFRSMRTGYEYGRPGLLPLRRFNDLSFSRHLPSTACDGVIEGLLEPEPESWLRNHEFPDLWVYLMHDICKRPEVLLLSFPIYETDEAFVVERAHVERALYNPKIVADRRIVSTKKMVQARKRYWESRTPVQQYAGGFSVPQLAIWSTIDLERLTVEWIKSSDEVWKAAKTNSMT